MPFKRGQPKIGGRKAGTPNKIGPSIKSIWARLGGEDGQAYAEVLHRIALEPHGDVHARLKALAIIAPYLWRKMAEQLEISGPEGGPLEVHDHFVGVLSTSSTGGA